MADPEVTIVIPLRDEELNVGPLHAELTAAMEKGTSEEMASSETHSG